MSYNILNTLTTFDQESNATDPILLPSSQPATIHMLERPGQVIYTENKFESNLDLSKYYTLFFVRVSRHKRDNLIYRCNLCGKSQKLECNFRSHLRAHMNIRPFSCSLCGKSFTTKSNCQTHIDKLSCR